MKFELDLLETIAYDVLDEDEIFSNVWVLSIMKNKGYFQYVPNDMTLKAINQQCKDLGWLDETVL